jgi:hypothetical protein
MWTPLVLLCTVAAACTRAAGTEKPMVSLTVRSLEAGTLVEAQLNDMISSVSSRRGGKVSATVTSGVTDSRGHVVIPGGSPVQLQIAALEPRRVTLRVTSLEVRGTVYVVRGQVDQPPHRVGSRGVVVTPGTRFVFPLERPFTVAAR